MKQNTISEVAVEVRRATPQDYLLEAVLASTTLLEYCVDAPAASARLPPPRQLGVVRCEPAGQSARGQPLVFWREKKENERMNRGERRASTTTISKLG